jgi:hypothetical protein
MHMYYRFHAETSQPTPTHEKMVRVYRRGDPYRTVLTVPEYEVVPPRASGMPDYCRAD